jgi:hypothetical protein
MTFQGLNKRKKLEIVFSNIKPESVSNKYAPEPAIKFIPEWYKQTAAYLPKKVEPDSLPTIKKCIPVLDAITHGYMILSPCDVFVKIENGVPKYQSALHGIVEETHPRKQAHLHPKADEFTYPKWINPWAVRTPKGYSTLFIPPMHNPNPWFTILPGIVDTDNYWTTVHLPFVLNDSTKECFIPAGTPIAQLVLIKRNNWKSIINEDSSNHHEVHKRIMSEWFDRYKHQFWERKSFE